MGKNALLCIAVDGETQLRFIEGRHVEEYFALIERNREHLREWVAVDAYEGSLEELRAYVKQRLLRFADGEGYHLGIWYRNALMGLLDYRLSWRCRKAELGYWIDASLQGKGLVTKACRIMLVHAFEEHRLNKVEISCAVENTRSRAVAERLGFTQEGILRQADRLRERYVDDVFYGLLADEWRLREAGQEDQGDAI